MEMCRAEKLPPGGCRDVKDTLLERILLMKRNESSHHFKHLKLESAKCLLSKVGVLSMFALTDHLAAKFSHKESKKAMVGNSTFSRMFLEVLKYFMKCDSNSSLR